MAKLPITRKNAENVVKRGARVEKRLETSSKMTTGCTKAGQTLAATKLLSTMMLADAMPSMAKTEKKNSWKRRRAKKSGGKESPTTMKVSVSYRPGDPPPEPKPPDSSSATEGRTTMEETMPVKPPPEPQDRDSHATVDETFLTKLPWMNSGRYAIFESSG